MNGAGPRASRAAPSICRADDPGDRRRQVAPKADAGALTLQQQVFRPRRLIEACGHSDGAGGDQGLGAEVTVADGLPELLVGDAVRLRAALENLIDNAVKFTERGAVRLDVARRVPRTDASNSSSPLPTAASA